MSLVHLFRLQQEVNLSMISQSNSDMKHESFSLVLLRVEINPCCREENKLVSNVCRGKIEVFDDLWYQHFSNGPIRISAFILKNNKKASLQSLQGHEDNSLQSDWVQ